METRAFEARRTREERCLSCHAAFSGPDRRACLQCGGEVHISCAEADDGRCAVIGCAGHYSSRSSGTEKQRSERHQVLVESRRANIILLVSLGGLLLGLHIVLGVFLNWTGPRLWIVACLAFAAAGASATSRALRQCVALTWRRIASAEASLQENVGRVVCLSGPAQASATDLTSPGGEPCLWFKTEQQRRATSSEGAREGAWLYVGDSALEYCLPLRMGDATVANQPSEVSGGAQEVVDLPSRGDGTQRRRVTRRLDLGSELTVVGRLRRREDGYHIIRDPWSGLLLTTEPWGERRRKELWETIGYAFLTAALAALAAW